jgi:hypothetical protein
MARTRGEALRMDSGSWTRWPARRPDWTATGPMALRALLALLD